MSAQTIFAELQLNGIEPATLVTGPSNSTTELAPLSPYMLEIEQN